MDDLHINKKLTIPAAALSWSAARASGPGGQHVNKTSTKVELIFDPALCAIADEVVERMRTASPSRFDNDGRVHVVAQDSRSQSTNLETALRRLADLVRAAWKRPPPRRPTRPTRGSKERRLQAKRVRSEVKKNRGKRWRGDG